MIDGKLKVEHRHPGGPATTNTGIIFENPYTPGNYLVIPYYTGDQGYRPPPSADPFWMCKSIMINGRPYAGQELPRGETVNLSLTAVNLGTLPAPTICLFFWANPTTSFTSASLQLIGQTIVSLVYNVLTTSPSVTWTVPEDTPQHICLLAEVTTGSDPAPKEFGVDRHFGQQNVYLTAAPPGGEIRIGFFAGNNRATAARFRLEATPVLVNHPALHPIVDPGSTLHKPAEVHLAHSRSDAGRHTHSLHVDLAAGETREIELRVVVPSNAALGSTVILQLAQYPERQLQPVGGLGVIVRVTAERAEYRPLQLW
jgi:hypothetical protein